MTYEDDLNRYIQQVANLHLSARTAAEQKLPESAVSLVRTFEEQTKKAQDTLTANKNALVRAYGAADEAGKKRLEQELQEMVQSIQQAERELRKILGG